MVNYSILADALYDLESEKPISPNRRQEATDVLLRYVREFVRPGYELPIDGDWLVDKWGAVKGCLIYRFPDRRFYCQHVNVDWYLKMFDGRGGVVVEKLLNRGHARHLFTALGFKPRD